LTVRAVGSGEIGKTPDLKAEVLDADGNVIEELNLGEGYEAGSEIELLDGATVSFSAGNIAAGDSFETPLVADSDNTGFLSATGLNRFFEGDGSSNIAVRKNIVENPNQIATSRSGEIGDTRNLEGLIGLRNEVFLGDGNLTFDDFLAETNTEIGFRVQSSISIQVNISELNSQYESARDSVSGVDVNEELLNLTKHQKSYEAAIQVVRTIESMFDELFQIIR
jgi:flagellar hook-associated protein 1 FlgK